LGLAGGDEQVGAERFAWGDINVVGVQFLNGGWRGVFWYRQVAYLGIRVSELFVNIGIDLGYVPQSGERIGHQVGRYDHDDGNDDLVKIAKYQFRKIHSYSLRL